MAMLGQNKSCLPWFLSISAFKGYSFLCLEVKMERLLCHQQARQQFLQHQSPSQSVPETRAAAASHREFYNVDPRFLACKAVMSFSCQDRLLPPAVLSFGYHNIASYSASTWIWSFSSSCFLWLAGSSHTPLDSQDIHSTTERRVMKSPRVQHLLCAKPHATQKCEEYHEVINLSQD